MGRMGNGGCLPLRSLGIIFQTMVQTSGLDGCAGTELFLCCCLICTALQPPCLLLCYSMMLYGGLNLICCYLCLKEVGVPQGSIHHVHAAQFLAQGAHCIMHLIATGW